MALTEVLNIAPEVGILGVFRFLNYKPWFAIAEFIDNSIQSAVLNRPALESLSGRVPFKLKINIDLDPDISHNLTIRDNAAGIFLADFARAFKAGSPPSDRSGLSEFGVGMKSAAFWLAKKWAVRTQALGDDVIREVAFDVDRIVSSSISNIDVKRIAGNPGDHFTELSFEGLNTSLHGRTLGKIRSHVASIYRGYMNDFVEISLNGKLLEYLPPEVLVAAPFADSTANPIRWWKKINMDLGGGQSVTGFAAIRKVADVDGAGFALLRRGRVIVGSSDDGYKPLEIFGKSNSFTAQRLFGELNLSGFEVTHTKDGIRWGESEQALIELLKESLNAAPLQLLSQADGYRVRRDWDRGVQTIERVFDSVQASLNNNAIVNSAAIVAGNLISVELESTSDPDPVLESHLSESFEFKSRQLTYLLDHHSYSITMTLDRSPQPKSLFTFSPDEGDSEVDATAKLFLAHPMVAKHIGSGFEGLDLLIQVIASLVVAEVIVRRSGDVMPGSVRRVFNRLVRGV